MDDLSDVYKKARIEAINALLGSIQDTRTAEQNEGADGRGLIAIADAVRVLDDMTKFDGAILR